MTGEVWSCYECGWEGEANSFAPSGNCWNCEEEDEAERRADYGAEE